MKKVLLINEHDVTRTLFVDVVPIVGDLVGNTLSPYPRVKNVLGYPEILKSDFAGTGLDAVITV